MNKYIDKRSFTRFEANLKGTFLIKGSIKSEECTIVDISRKGLGVELNTRERILKGSLIYIEIYPPGELSPINLKGTIKWIKQEEGKLEGGVELSKALDDDVLARLS
ncbi:MAG: PilZ domain-containing protein [Deltaproteobacteria bacterium]|nr:PilZ domain-containing protein [Deltaproteobacteria bacterium]